MTREEADSSVGQPVLEQSKLGASRRLASDGRFRDQTVGPQTPAPASRASVPRRGYPPTTLRSCPAANVHDRRARARLTSEPQPAAEHRIHRHLELTSTGILIKLFCMRTTLDLPAPLLDEAQRLLGFKSKTDTVVLSLTELIRRRRIDELKTLAGRVDLGIDLGRSRRVANADRAVRGARTQTSIRQSKLASRS